MSLGTADERNDDLRSNRERADAAAFAEIEGARTRDEAAPQPKVGGGRTNTTWLDLPS